MESKTGPEMEMNLEVMMQNETAMAMNGKRNRKRKNLEMTMAEDYEQFDPTDRLSDLPEFILHDIFSLLDAKQSCFLGLISRKFHRLWSTMPVLIFDVPRNPNLSFIYFIHKTMLRYSDNDIIIKKFRLRIQIDQYLGDCLHVGLMIDNWIRIAVTNHVEILDLCIVPYDGARIDYCFKQYRLPELILSAKSLKVLQLHNVEFIDYDVNGGTCMNLSSLEGLHLREVHVKNDYLLRHMVTSCPLKVVEIRHCTGFISHLNFSKSSTIREVVIRQEYLSRFGKVNLINLEASTVEEFNYCSGDVTEEWPLRIADPPKLLNLRRLTIRSDTMTDKMVESLVHQLPSLENLMLHECSALKRAKISSFSLQKFQLDSCSQLEKVEIDAPNLDSFCFSWVLYGNYPILTLSKRPTECKAIISQRFDYHVMACYFNRLWEFLMQSNIFTALDLSIAVGDKVHFNLEDVEEFHPGPPYKLNELELKIGIISTVDPAVSFLIEGLFWSFRPSVLSLPLNMTRLACISTKPYVHKITMQTLMEKLSSCAISWRLAMNGVEVECIDWDHFYEKSNSKGRKGYIDFTFNLCW